LICLTLAILAVNDWHYLQPKAVSIGKGAVAVRPVNHFEKTKTKPKP
jgi:hypothetical protein